jgi:uncharacterized protein (TIGR03435 family)
MTDILDGRWTRKQRIAFAAALVACAAAAAVAQSRATFDVTMVRRSSGAPGTPVLSNFQPGRFHATNITLRTVIAFLYIDGTRVPYRILGGPDWLDAHAFDIEGKVLEGTPSQETLRLMAQALLADRFGLKVHYEDHDSPVYELVLQRADGRLGEGLHPSTGSDCASGSTPAAAATIPRCGLFLSYGSEDLILSGNNVPMDQVARHIQTVAGRPVIDRTGLTGGFSFRLSVPRRTRLDADSGVASMPGGVSAMLPAAVSDQLGLKLVAARGPVEVLVIDSVQLPTEN